MSNRFFYFGVLPALAFQLIGATLYFVLLKDSAFSQYIYFSTKVLLVVWPLIWIKQIKSHSSYFWGKEKKTSIISGLVSGLVIFATILIIYLLFKDYWSQFNPAVIQSAQDLKIINHYLLFSFFLSVVHSFIEEYYWRWFAVNGLMTKFKKNTAIYISAIAFTSHHFIVAIQFSNIYLALLASAGIFGLAVFWSHQFFKTRSIIGPWISHFFADIVIMGIGYTIIAPLV